MIILASTSKIRQKILGNAGVIFQAAAASFDEQQAKQKLKHLSPHELATALAKGKAAALSVRSPEALVIGADQTLSCDGQIFSKPATITEARLQLAMLQGKTHTLHTAVSAYRNKACLWNHCEDAKLTMRTWTNQFLDDYVLHTGDELLTSVGAYKLEQRGIQLFEKVEGDYFTILGLPLIPLLSFLRRQNELLQ